MKTNHRRRNPPQFQRQTHELTADNFKESGGPNYSLMGYRARMKHGVPGMDHDSGHRGNAKDIREVKTARKRTERRVANRAVKRSFDVEQGI
jgi:hypothetical protein